MKFLFEREEAPLFHFILKFFNSMLDKIARTWYNLVRN